VEVALISAGREVLKGMVYTSIMTEGFSCNILSKTGLSEAYRQRWQNEAVIREIVQKYRTIALVGISANTQRPSYFVGAYLKHHGLDIIPVNPGQKEILGVPCYPSLSAIPRPVDVVDIFRRPDQVLPIVEEAIKIKAKVAWFQFEVVNIEAGELAEKNGLTVVMDRCLKIEHGRYSGGLHMAGMNTGIIIAKKP
jgi:hypothetical protein